MLETLNLVVEVNNKIVINDVSIKVETGNITALMGPNGSGKTSLVYAIMGHPYYRILKGSILIDGLDYTFKPTHERAIAGLFLVFQNPIELPGVSLESLIRSAVNKRLGKNDLLEHVPGLPERILGEAKLIGLKDELIARDLNIGFSGGERKRSEILQARVLRPKYLILDEPDSGLDVDGVRIIADYIKEVAYSNGGVLLVTHNPTLLSYVEPSIIYVMLDGRIVAEGGLEIADKIAREGYNWLR
ncbi:MAG: Fe-S cluster assembly ATPase SufC [Desulfurococcus sp.]|uniref:Fe-S cluster assembly ATPase SufC n=1 Tax=Desulfurococcus sp. TaxID=51678 RepID=UPI003163D5E7